MPRYKTEVSHDLGKDEATRRLKRVVEQARSSSDLKGSWSENAYTFSVSIQGMKLDGTLRVEADKLELDCRLPLIAMPFAGWIPRVLKKALTHRIHVEEATPVSPRIESESSEQAGADDSAPAVLFLHIPKAGGQTLGEYVYNQCSDERYSDEGAFNAGVLFLTYGFVKEPNLIVPEYVIPALHRTDLRAVIGHFWYGLHEHVTRPSTYITILRNPVDRVLSLYYYLKLQNNMSLEEFVSSPPIKEVDNDQTRRIAGVDPEIGECTSETLRIAKENLRRDFSVVGTTERFDETLILLKRRLGWVKEILSYPKNVNPNRLSSDSLPQEVVDGIMKWNELDSELWHYANGLMDEAIKREGSAFHDDLGKYKALRPVAQSMG